MIGIRIGIGYDVHPFSENRDLIIGGERIDFKYGLLGHSDADVLVHAIIDSLLGASNLGDIGRLFPDTSDEFADISSIELLKRVNKLILSRNIEIINIDTILLCEEPKIAPYVDKMKANLSFAMKDLSISRIGIKGKTTEKLGFTGKGEGIAAYAISLINCIGI